MKHLLVQLLAGTPLSEAQAQEAFESIMTGAATPAQIASVLTLIQNRGPTEDELVGAARVMRSKAVPVATPIGMTIIDTCGTGGTGSRLFNISTAAGLVAAAAGRSRGIGVAKHGNRSVTSASGSSQVLEALGVKINVTPATLTRCLEQVGFCFCYAPLHHPAMKFAAPVRAELGFRTIFNLLGPLTNPAGAVRQLIGVYDPVLTEPIARVLARLGTQRAMVVYTAAHGLPGMGELVAAGPMRITRLENGRVHTVESEPAAMGVPAVNLAEMTVTDSAASATLIHAIFSRRPGAARETVCLNAAAALEVAGVVRNLHEGLDLAAQAIDTGSAARTLEKLVTITRQDPGLSA